MYSIMFSFYCFEIVVCKYKTMPLGDEKMWIFISSQLQLMEWLVISTKGEHWCKTYLSADPSTAILNGGIYITISRQNHLPDVSKVTNSSAEKISDTKWAKCSPSFTRYNCLRYHHGRADIMDWQKDGKYPTIIHPRIKYINKSDTTRNL